MVCKWVFTLQYFCLKNFIILMLGWSEVKWSCSVVSNSLRPHGLSHTTFLHPWDFPGKSTGVGGQRKKSSLWKWLCPEDSNMKKFKQRLEPSMQIRNTSRNSPSEQKEKWKCSCSIVSNSLWPHGLQPARLLCPWKSSGKNIGVGCHSLLQGIFPT